MNNALLLIRAARAHPLAPALALGSRVLADYATLAARVARIAGGLATLGLAPGERIALVMKNHPAYLELLLAAWHAGLAAVPIHSKLHPKELGFIFANSGAKAVFATAGTRTACEEGAAQVPLARHVFDVDGRGYADLAASPATPGTFRCVSGAMCCVTAWTRCPSSATSPPWARSCI